MHDTDREPVPSFVSVADGEFVHVMIHERAIAHALSALGFERRDGAEFVLRVTDDIEKGRLFAQLRDRGVAFARGREWNPAELFEWLREEGYVTGPFRSIAWRDPMTWVVREE